MKRNRLTVLLLIVVGCFIQQEKASRRPLNPQEFISTRKLIRHWRYRSEEYEILTDDGYYLHTNRIPYGIHGLGITVPRPVVLLVHGLNLDGRCWVTNLPNNSLGFVLADAGYDVWIIHLRGTTWSRRHQYLSVEQEEFWNFTFHENAMYDIPAAVNFILQKTGQDGLYFIGHSQGASLGFITFSAMPQLARKIKLFMSFAPSYTFVGTRGPVYLTLKAPESLIKLIWGTKEFCIVGEREKVINSKLCSLAVMDRFCLQVIFFFLGHNEKNINMSQLTVYSRIYPESTSVKTIIHWNQIAKSKRFQYFDYGSKNKAMYNSNKPPLYEIEAMTVPSAVWSAEHDKIENKKDIELLLPRIPNLIFYKHMPEWEHADFIWGLDGPQYLFPKVLQLMHKYK